MVIYNIQIYSRIEKICTNARERKSLLKTSRVMLVQVRRKVSFAPHLQIPRATQA